jgi:hypothetical protein
LQCITPGEEAVGRSPPANGNTNVPVRYLCVSTQRMVDGTERTQCRPALHVGNALCQRAHRTDWASKRLMMDHCPLGTILGVCNADCGTIRCQPYCLSSVAALGKVALVREVPLPAKWLSSTRSPWQSCSPWHSLPSLAILGEFTFLAASRHVEFAVLGNFFFHPEQCCLVIVLFCGKAAFPNNLASRDKGDNRVAFCAGMALFVALAPA